MSILYHSMYSVSHLQMCLKAIIMYDFEDCMVS